MRICLISGEFPPMQGGVGDYTRELGHAMAILGHDVMILTSVNAAGMEQSVDFRVFPIVEDWGWFFLRSANTFFAQKSPDVVNIQYQTAAYGMKPAINLLPGYMRLRGGKRPIMVVTFHDLLVPFLFRGAGPLRRWVTDVLARRVDGVVATNEEDAASLDERAPDTPRRLIPIGSNITPTSLDEFDRQTWRDRWGITKDQLALSYFGFLNQSKGGEELIEALGKLVAGGRGAKLIMIGGQVGASDPTNMAYLSHVEQLIDRLSLEERVIWTDYLPDHEVTATLKASDVCVLPYRDGVSTRRGTLMAALAHGLPIVTTTPRVPLAQFRDGENMLLVPPENPDAIAGAVARLADDAALREQVGAGAAALAEQYTWPAIAEATMKFYADLKLGRL